MVEKIQKYRKCPAMLGRLQSLDTSAARAGLPGPCDLKLTNSILKKGRLLIKNFRFYFINFYRLKIIYHNKSNHCTAVNSPKF